MPNSIISIYIHSWDDVWLHACMVFIYNVDLMLLSSIKGDCRSVLSNGILSRGGMDRYGCLDVRYGANSTRACSWMSCEHLECVHGGVFQPNHCLQPQLDMAVSRKRLRLCLIVLLVYISAAGMMCGCMHA